MTERKDDDNLTDHDADRDESGVEAVDEPGVSESALPRPLPLQYHWVDGERRTFGPLPWSTIVEEIGAGRAVRTNLSWVPGEETWSPLGARTEFAAAFASREVLAGDRGAEASDGAALPPPPPPPPLADGSRWGSSSEPTVPATPRERTLAMWLHLSGLLGVFFPFVGLAIPFTIWMVHKDESRFIDRHGYVLFDAWICYLLYCLVGAFLTFVCVGFLILGFLFIASIVGTIIVAMAASRGEVRAYPLTFKILGPQGQD